MSNEATNMYSTWFSIESAGYCERSLALGLRTLGDSDEPRDEVDEVPSVLCIGGCGDRLFISLRVETEDGVREEGGKDEKDGCRCRAGKDGALPFILWVNTSAMRDSILGAGHLGVARSTRRGVGILRGNGSGTDVYATGACNMSMSDERVRGLRSTI
jgi:hypothetical protein